MAGVARRLSNKELSLSNTAWRSSRTEPDTEPDMVAIDAELNSLLYTPAMFLPPLF
jgi:hypothetical protein